MPTFLIYKSLACFVLLCLLNSSSVYTTSRTILKCKNDCATPLLKILVCLFTVLWGGGDSQSFSRHTELFRGLFTLLYYTVCFLKCSTQAVTKYHFLSCLFISGYLRSEHAVSSTENETFQHMCLLHCFANAYSCFRNH